MLPSTVVELTPGWLTEVLRGSGSLETGRVISVSPVTLGGGAGLMSHMTRLLLAYDVDVHGAPETLIAKFPPEDAGSHLRGVELGFFEGESGFYSALSTQTAIRAPRCYFAQFDALTGKFLILLEDLSSARLGDVSVGCNDREAALAVKTLARFHASWWNSGSLAEYAWLRKLTDRLEDLLCLLPESWPTFVSRFRATLDTNQFEMLSGVNEHLGGSRRVLMGGSQTLLHGDFKLDNLFFLPSGEIVAVDWGLVMAGPGMFDVAFFLSQNLLCEDRRRLEIDLIHTYVRALAAAGVRQYDFGNALADYRLQLVGLLPRLIAAGGLAQFADQQAVEQYAVGLRRVLCAVNDHGGLIHRPWD